MLDSKSEDSVSKLVCATMWTESPTGAATAGAHAPADKTSAAVPANAAVRMSTLQGSVSREVVSPFSSGSIHPQDN